jgi:hypothetical protein
MLQMKANPGFTTLNLPVLAGSSAQEDADDPARAVASAAAAQLEQHYVFPAKAKVAASLLRERSVAGAYDGKTSDALAVLITADLATVLHDKHVRVRYSHEVLPPESPGDDEPSAVEQAQRAALERSIGFGVQRSAHLPGNVGYIDIRIFAGATAARNRAIDGLADSVAYSDAVILDLRQNRGGDPDAVARLLSHFLPPDTHLNDFVGPGDVDAKIESSTYTSKIEGPRITVPLYVLTSSTTFSGGEECAYDVQALKRGTLVGETTGGGANPGMSQRVDDHFDIFVPEARARNPITMTNWEGSGVIPDVPVPADRALVIAYAMALDEKLNDPSLDAGDRNDVKHIRDGLDASDDDALLTDPADHVRSSTAGAPEDPAITARVRDLFARVRSGNLDRTQFSARFSAFLTPDYVDFAKNALGQNGPAKLVYLGESATPAGKTWLYDAQFATAPTIHLTIVSDAEGKIDNFSFKH